MIDVVICGFWFSVVVRLFSSGVNVGVIVYWFVVNVIEFGMFSFSELFGCLVICVFVCVVDGVSLFLIVC